MATSLTKIRVIGLAIGLTGALFSRQGFAGEDYPFFTLSGVAPDILIVLDASGSMNFPLIPEDDPTPPWHPPPPIRHDVAAAVISDMVGSNPDVRWGLVRTLNYDHLACQKGVTEIRLGEYDKGAATTDAFKIRLEEPPPPLGSGISYGGPKDLEGGLMAAVDEWLRAIGDDPDRACRKKAMIIVTGGGVDPVPCSYVDLVEQVQRIYSMAPEAGGLGNIQTYVIGFNLKGDDAHPELDSYEVLDDMAEAGQGLNPAAVESEDIHPYDAKNIAEFNSALSYCLNDIIYGSYTNSDPVVTADGSDVYQAYFEILPDNQALAWKGHIVDYLVNEEADYSLTRRMDVADWLNGQSYSSRKIYTGRVTGGVDGLVPLAFNSSNAGTLGPLMKIDEKDVDCDGTTTGSVADAEALIRFVAGDSSAKYMDCGSTYREPWRMLDVFHSTPVLVPPPNSASIDPDYWAYQDVHASRPDMLMAGSNGGMFHSFRVARNTEGVRIPSDGEELWSYIPAHLLPKLFEMWDMYPHPTYVDATAAVRDVKVRLPSDAGGRQWHTVAVFGNGVSTYRACITSTGECCPASGYDPTADPNCNFGYYTALDISKLSSSTYSFDPLWEFSGDGDIVYAKAEPTIDQVRVNLGDGNVIKNVAFLPGKGLSGGGISSPFAPIYVVDLEANQGDDALAKIEIPWRTTDTTINHGIWGRVLAVDTTDDLVADRLYVGDMEGRLWRVNMRSSDTSAWSDLDSLEMIFDPSDVGAPRLPITYPATAVYTLDGDVMIYFGTGDPTTAHAGMPSGAFYALLDSKVPGEYSHLLNSDDGDWPIQFDDDEVLAGRPIVVNGVLFFTTYLSDVSGNDCYKGAGRLYAVGYLQADARYKETPDATESSKYVDLGPGIPSSVVVGYDRWYVSMNNAAVGDGSGIVGDGPKTVGTSKSFFGELRPYGWVEVAGKR